MFRRHSYSTAEERFLRDASRPRAIRKGSNGADAWSVPHMQELRLQSYHDFDGAVFRTEAGWSVPAGYRSGDAEPRAATPLAGMVALSDRAKTAHTGS